MDYDHSVIDQAHSEHEFLWEDPKTVKKRARADKRRRRKYKFSDKKHSLGGIIATILVIPEIALIAFAIYLAAIQKGQGTEIVGWLPFISLILATIGIVLSALGLRKDDTIYTFAWIGLIASIVIWLFLAVMMVAGM